MQTDKLYNIIIYVCL